MNRRGMSILADLSWLLAYIIIAILCYAFLYSNVRDRYNEEITSEYSQVLAGNAQYTANALLSHEALAGITESSPGTFGRSVSKLGTKYEIAKSKSPGLLPLISGTGTTYERSAELKAFPAQVEGSSYKATLDSVFGPTSVFWQAQTTDRPLLESVIVTLYTSETAIVQDTCIMYNRPGFALADVCKHPILAEVANNALAISLQLINKLQEVNPFLRAGVAYFGDPVVELSVPKASQPRTVTVLADKYSETGVVYVPTESGSVRFGVTMVWVE